MLVSCLYQSNCQLQWLYSYFRNLNQSTRFIIHLMLKIHQNWRRFYLYWVVWFIQSSDSLTMNKMDEFFSFFFSSLSSSSSLCSVSLRSLWGSLKNFNRGHHGTSPQKQDLHWSLKYTLGSRWCRHCPLGKPHAFSPFAPRIYLRTSIMINELFIWNYYNFNIRK